MKRPVLDRFQGAFVGAAIADLMALNIIPASSGLGGEWGFPDDSQEIPDGALTSGSPGRVMIDVALSFLPSDLQSFGESTWQVSENIVAESESWLFPPLAGAIAHIPLSLFRHEETTDLQRGYRQLARLEGASVSSVFSNRFNSPDPAALVITFTLGHILSETFCPTTHLPRILTFLEKRGDEKIGNGKREAEKRLELFVMKDVLHQVHQALVQGRGAVELAYTLQAMTDVSLSSDQRSEENLMIRQHGSNLTAEGSATDGAIALGILLFCFLSTPSHYGLAVTRLKQVCSILFLPTEWTTASCVVLGALSGSYVGIWHLPMQNWSRLHRTADGEAARGQALTQSEALEYRWGIQPRALEELGWKLWAIWSGFDRLYVASLIQEGANRLECVTASPNVIRIFGN